MDPYLFYAQPNCPGVSFNAVMDGVRRQSRAGILKFYENPVNHGAGLLANIGYHHITI